MGRNLWKSGPYADSCGSWPSRLPPPYRTWFASCAFLLPVSSAGARFFQGLPGTMFLDRERRDADTRSATVGPYVLNRPSPAPLNRLFAPP